MAAHAWEHRQKPARHRVGQLRIRGTHRPEMAGRLRAVLRPRLHAVIPRSDRWRATPDALRPKWRSDALRALPADLAYRKNQAGGRVVLGDDRQQLAVRRRVELELVRPSLGRHARTTQLHSKHPVRQQCSLYHRSHPARFKHVARPFLQNLDTECSGSRSPFPHRTRTQHTECQRSPTGIQLLGHPVLNTRFPRGHLPSASRR